MNMDALQSFPRVHAPPGNVDDLRCSEAHFGAF